MSSRKIRVSHGIKHSEDVDIADLPEGKDGDVADMLEKGKSKIRITTMVDIDLLDELKRRAHIDGDGRYQTYLNQFLRAALFAKKNEVDRERVVDLIKSIVKPSALKRNRA